MSATDELRRMLDEHGVEYETEDRPTIRYTEWGDWLFSEPLDAKPHTLGAQCELMRIPATPAQAIAATLGSGECRNEGDQSDFLCSECGGRMFTDTDDTYTMIDSLGNIIEQPKYCPNCGRRIVEVD